MPKSKVEIDAGDLRRPITIEQPMKVSDGAGGEVVTWVKFVAAHAHIEPYKGSQILAANLITTAIWVRVYVRYQPGINTTMRVKDTDGTLYSIRSVADQMTKRIAIELLCQRYE